METIELPAIGSIRRRRWLPSVLDRSSKPFESHDLIMAARMTALLEDLGVSAFRMRLDAMLNHWQRGLDEAATAEHRRAIRRWLTQIVVRRAELVDLSKKNPDLPDKPLPPPIVVTGLPGAPIQATVADLQNRLADLAVNPDGSGVDRPSTGLEVSFWGLVFCQQLGVELAQLMPSEADEVYWFHRLQLVAGGTTNLKNWLMAGADHAFAIDALLRTYPKAVVLEAPIKTSDAVTLSLENERTCALALGRNFDPDTSRSRWVKIVDLARTRLDSALDTGVLVASTNEAAIR